MAEVGEETPPIRPPSLADALIPLVALVFLPQERFRIPVIDPALIVGTAIWVSFARQRAAV